MREKRKRGLIVGMHPQTSCFHQKRNPIRFATVLLLALAAVFGLSLVVGCSTPEPAVWEDDPDELVSAQEPFEPLTRGEHNGVSAVSGRQVYPGQYHGLNAAGILPAEPAAGAVTPSIPSGAYAKSFELSFSAGDGIVIRYTLDGSDPSADSEPYAGPLRITNLDGQPGPLTSEASVLAMHEPLSGPVYVPWSGDVAKATVVKAQGFSPDGEPVTPISTNTYFVGKSIAERYGGAAVISLVTDPASLLDYDSGIFVPGAVHDSWFQTPEGMEAAQANEFWKAPGNYSQHGREWERVATVQMFDGQDEVSFSVPCGIRVRGGATRAYDQKSLNIYFRKDYGMKELEYPLFETVKDENGTRVGKYKSFMLRSGGNDTFGMKYRDSLLQSLLDGMDFETQSSRPAVLFVNGEYWGVYSMMEKYSDDMLEEEYGVNDDDVVMIKDEQVDEGTDTDLVSYQELMSYCEEDLSDPAIWEELNEIADMGSFADYSAAQVYIGNLDWISSRNTALWKAKGDDGHEKWRWMLYDTDYSTALLEDYNVQADYDTLRTAIVNQPLLEAALDNDEFKAMFKDSLSKVSSYYLNPERVKFRLDEYKRTWEPLMSDFYARFGNTQAAYDSRLEAFEAYIGKRGEAIIDMVGNDLNDYESFKLDAHREMETATDSVPSEVLEEDAAIIDEAVEEGIGEGQWVAVEELPAEPGYEASPDSAANPTPARGPEPQEPSDPDSIMQLEDEPVAAEEGTTPSQPSYP